MGRPRTVRPQLRRDSLGSSGRVPKRIGCVMRITALAVAISLASCSSPSDRERPSASASLDSMIPSDSADKILAAYMQGSLTADVAAKALLDVWDRTGGGSVNLEMGSELQQAIAREAQARRRK